jgi:hypothetical protein
MLIILAIEPLYLNVLFEGQVYSDGALLTVEI